MELDTGTSDPRSGSGRDEGSAAWGPVNGAGTDVTFFAFSTNEPAFAGTWGSEGGTRRVPACASRVGGEGFARRTRGRDEGTGTAPTPGTGS
ncbi:hypothetical protein ACN28E_46640 [Archangium lansingense]|uniref:hypothetical protein n=1 Tax=Archangium lansingense TaxID=2995310 RepID=UPI003B7E2A2C